jgi:uncharacterized membrane protein YkvA (DUF1232 family)
MALRVSSWLSRPTLVRTLITHVRLSLRLLRDPEVPLRLKALPILTACYMIAPVDLAPDILPIIGQIDDLAILLIALETFLRLSPTDAVNFHRTALAQRRRYSPAPHAGQVIDAEFRRKDDA